MKALKNITLIGMPGSGKSTVGKLLAQRLGYSFLDVDDLIRQTGRALQPILDTEGELEFVNREETAIMTIGGEEQVIAPGGSCVLSQKAMEHLRKISFVMFLAVPFEILFERIEQDIADRGIVGLRRMGEESWESAFRRVYDFRKAFYVESCHVCVTFPDWSLSPEAAARSLERMYRSRSKSEKKCGRP